MRLLRRRDREIIEYSLSIQAARVETRAVPKNLGDVLDNLGVREGTGTFDGVVSAPVDCLNLKHQNASVSDVGSR